MRNFTFSLLLLCSGLFASLPAIASSEIEFSPIGSVSDEYPGLNRITNTVSDVSQNLLSLGCQYYFRVNGRYPAKWQDVVHAGLVSVDLRGFKDELIEPDVPELTFLGDLYYECGPDGHSAVLHRLENFDGMSVAQYPLVPPGTYAQAAELAAQYSGEQAAVNFFDEVEVAKLYASMGIINGSISFFRTVHGRYPSDFSEFLRSGLGPINELSLNPRTGNTYVGDGRPGDISYKLSSDGTAFNLRHINADGGQERMGFTY